MKKRRKEGAEGERREKGREGRKTHTQFPNLFYEAGLRLVPKPGKDNK